MMDKKPHIKPYLYGMLAGFGAISLSIIFFFLIYRFDGFGDAISTLTGILMPFIYGAVIAYLLKPEMYRMEETFVDVELEGSMTKGCTLVDLKGYLGKPANAKVCMDIDQEMFRAWFLESIGRCI